MHSKQSAPMYPDREAHLEIENHWREKVKEIISLTIFDGPFGNSFWWDTYDKQSYQYLK